MSSILFVPFDNGLGHIRRLSILANNINFRKNKVSFIIKKKKEKKIKLKKEIKKISSLDEVKKKKFFRKIFFDNKINKELISNSEKSFIFANFFWEELQKKNLDNIKFIKRKKIKIFANYLFMNIKSNLKVNRVNFFEKFNPNKKNDSILIAVGSAKSRLIKEFKQNIIHLLRLNIFEGKRVFLDPRLYNSKLQKFNIHKADFSKKMYSKILFAIIKPGLGTIEECLKRAIIILPIMENENSEFKYNSKVLLKHKLGLKFKNIKRTFKFINQNFNNIKLQKTQLSKCKNLRWNGQKKILSFFK